MAIIISAERVSLPLGGALVVLTPATLGDIEAVVPAVSTVRIADVTAVAAGLTLAAAAPAVSGGTDLPLLTEASVNLTTEAGAIIYA